MNLIQGSSLSCPRMVIPYRLIDALSAKYQMTNLLADATVTIATRAGRVGNDAASPLSPGKEARRCAFCLRRLGRRVRAVVVRSRAHDWYGSVDWGIASARCSSASSLQLW